MPVMEFKSNAKPSQFAYPPPMEEKKEKQVEKIETAVLSITNKAKKRQQEKSKTQEPEKMDVVRDFLFSVLIMMNHLFSGYSGRQKGKERRGAGERHR